MQGERFFAALRMTRNGREERDRWEWGGEDVGNGPDRSVVALWRWLQTFLINFTPHFGQDISIRLFCPFFPLGTRRT